MKEKLSNTKLILLICFLFVFCPIVKANNCIKYLKPRSKILSLKPSEIPLDTFFYNKDGSVKILKSPFVWAIKDQNQILVGLLVGTSHDYISLDMFPNSFRSLLLDFDNVMTEHSSKKNGDLNKALISHSLDPSQPSLYSQLTPQERDRVMNDFLDYQKTKTTVSVLLRQGLYSPKNSFVLSNLSPYGFMDRLSDNAQLATSELRTQPVQLDDQIARLAQYYGAEWSYLEEGPEHLIHFSEGFNVDQVRRLLSSSENIFEQSYFASRDFLRSYSEGNLVPFKNYADQLTEVERKKFLTDRNKHWIPKIAAKLQSGQLSLIIAGLYHFVGQDSVIELLTAEGYSVERISE